MSSLEEIRAARFEKLKLLEKKGINPYPASTARTHTCAEARKEFEAEKEMVLAGRIMSLRAQGKIIFFDINDGSGRFQIFLKKGDPISDENFELFEQAFDIGDFVEVKGTLFLTKQDEKTLLAGEVKMLSKSLLPLPEKGHGLSDV